MKRSNFNHNYFIVFGVFWLLLIDIGYGQDLRQNPLNSLYTHYEHSISNKTLAGVETLLILNDRVVWHQAQGLADVATKTPLQPNSIYYIQSMTKPIISVAIMQLVEHGLLTLDDPIEMYIPEAKDLRVALNLDLGVDSPTQKVNRSLTILDLLTHTSGLSHGLGDSKLDQQLFKALYDETLNYRSHNSLEDRVTTLLSFPLVAQPGTQWYYSAGADILALILQRVSKQSIPTYLKTNIFDPLDMHDTGYNLNELQSQRVMKLHSRNERDIVKRHEQQVPTSGNTIYGGTHGLFSTATDYAQFCLMILHNGTWNGAQILKADTVKSIRTNHTADLYNEQGAGFGLGFSVILIPEKMNRPGGVRQLQWDGYFSTHFFIDPNLNAIGITLTQQMPGGEDINTPFQNEVYRALN
jgi:CubicO group peptidase (beta-lactamase class C family)